MNILTEKRPTTAAEQEFYETMAQHYEQRSKEAPGNQVIRSNRRHYQQAAREKQVTTVSDPAEVFGPCYPGKAAALPSSIRPRQERQQPRITNHLP